MHGTLNHGPPVISIDVEDWPQSSWNRDLPITQRAADNTRRLLELLDRAGVRATMFVLGKLADRFPELVREIDAAGHEVAIHADPRSICRRSEAKQGCHPANYRQKGARISGT